MSRRRDRLGVALLATVLTLLGCSTDEELGEATDAAAHVEQVPGSQVSRVTLTTQAVSTLGIRTEQARGDLGPEHAAPGSAVAVRYSAVLYDTTGGTWVYTVVGSRSYLRVPVTVDRVEGGLAHLSDGLAADAAVVTVGAPELIGAEEGVGGE